MNTIKSLLTPLYQIAKDLGDSDRLKAHNTALMLKKLFDFEIDWGCLSYVQRLDYLASCLGYSSMFGKSAWSIYIQRISEVFGETEQEYKLYGPIPFNRFAYREDTYSDDWYTYLQHTHENFIQRTDILKKYLEIRSIEFNRYTVNDIGFINCDFDSPITPPDLANATDWYDQITAKNEKTFFKTYMGWLYLFDSKFLYCSFLNHCFRNAICHNVDFRYSIISSEEIKGDIMNADFSFCDNQYTEFSHCYGRKTKFYKTNLNCAQFKQAYLNGALFIKSSLKQVSFREAIIKNVSFKGSDLKEADFTNARIDRADFRGADLRNVKGLDISRIFIDETTLL